MSDEKDMSVTGRLERVETKVDRLEGRFDHLEGRFDHLEGRFDRLEGRFNHLEVRVDHLETKVDVGFEEMRREFRLLAELMGAGFDAMNRRFDDNLRALQARIGDHDAVLGNHGRRITALERRRK